MPFDAFISYSSKDKITADACCAVLEGAGVRCWIAPRDVRPGTEYGAAIIDGIQQSRLMVLIFSSSSNSSSQIHREIERAVSKGMPIIPVRIEEIVPTKSLEYFLGAIHWLDALTPPIENHLQQLSETVKAILQVAASTRSASPNGSAGQAHARGPDQGSTPTLPGAVQMNGVGEGLPAKRSTWMKWFWPALAGGVGVALIVAGLWLYLPRASVEKQCAGEVGAKSAATSTRTAIIFTNKTAAPIKIFWLDHQGVRKLYRELAPGSVYRQETYVNHIWIVTGASGNCLGLYRGEATTQEVNIGA
jgi:TIR domain/VHL beta domain